MKKQKYPDQSTQHRNNIPLQFPYLLQDFGVKATQLCTNLRLTHFSCQQLSRPLKGAAGLETVLSASLGEPTRWTVCLAGLLSLDLPSYPSEQGCGACSLTDVTGNRQTFTRVKVVRPSLACKDHPGAAACHASRRC